MADPQKIQQPVDNYGRQVNSLRISLTQKCNFNCFFCHKEGESNPRGQLSAEEIELIASVSSKLGVRRFKLTGGEPLLRRDIIEIVGRISSHAEEVSMTTNGYMLSNLASSLRKAGLKRVNISLHSNKPQTFREITGLEALQDVKQGIGAALDNGLNPIKLNMVVLNGVNSEEIYDMIQFSGEIGAILQLIEFQPLELGEKNWSQYYFDLKPVEKILDSRSNQVCTRKLHRRKQFFLEDGEVVEIVRPMHNSEFCRFCTRIRLTSDGYLKPCLMRGDNLVDVRSILRRSGSISQLENAFKQCIAKREPYWRDEN